MLEEIEDKKPNITEKENSINQSAAGNHQEDANKDEKDENEKTDEEKKEVVSLLPFELPENLNKLSDDTEDDFYAKFVAEPFESGYGHTLGNALRRVLLSSIEGAAITAIRISGIQHEFTTIPGILEDVTTIILNLKQVRFRHHSKQPATLQISVEKEGEVTAGDILENQHYEVVNKDLVICTLDSKVRFECELEICVGRGFNTNEENKHADMPIGLIAIDSIFSPVKRVKYAIENKRIGHKTDYDKLVLEIWTDGRIKPADAMQHAAAILSKHLDIFVTYNDKLIEFDAKKESQSIENAELCNLLNMSVNEIELSVRAANCLNNANISTVGQLAMKSEAEMLKYRNFGKKSLNEIKDKLNDMGLSLGMQFDPELLEQTQQHAVQMEREQRKQEEEDTDAMGLAELITQNIQEEIGRASCRERVCMFV